MLVVPCRQCLFCRINAARVWAHRIILESRAHDQVSFLTLTYRDEELPVSVLEDGGPGLPTLRKEDCSGFIKRLRMEVVRKFEGKKLRFFYVGEYGDNTQRPHYHLVCFGLGCEDISRCRDFRRLEGRSRCEFCELVEDSWDRGYVDVGELNFHSAQYISGYVTKKMTRVGDDRLLGRAPEFAQMSRRGGIGFNAIEDMADTLNNDSSWSVLEKVLDVPSTLSHGGKHWPLGRSIRNRLREMVFGSAKAFSEERRIRQKEEMRQLQEEYEKSAPLNSVGKAKFRSVKEILLDKNKGRMLKIEQRFRDVAKKEGIEDGWVREKV